MIKEHRKCDGKDCTNITLDEMKDGWIVVGDGGFKKYKGRHKAGVAIVEVYINKGSDFCSWKCLRSKK